jgi:hypothetical protein
VLNESAYKEKVASLLESGVYEIVHNDPTSQIERKIQKLLTRYKTDDYHLLGDDNHHSHRRGNLKSYRYKTVLPAASKIELTSYHSEPPHLYGLSKLHKPDIPLRLIVSSIICVSYFFFIGTTAPMGLGLPP